MNETTDYQESCLKNFFILDKRELDGVVFVALVIGALVVCLLVVMLHSAPA